MIHEFEKKLELIQKRKLDLLQTTTKSQTKEKKKEPDELKKYLDNEYLLIPCFFTKQEKVKLKKGQTVHLPF
jgi:hypothetical protein